MYECSKCGDTFKSLFALGLHWTAMHAGRGKVCLVNWWGKIGKA